MTSSSLRLVMSSLLLLAFAFLREEASGAPGGLPDLPDGDDETFSATLVGVDECEGVSDLKVRMDNCRVERVGKNAVAIYSDLHYSTRIEKGDMWNIKVEVSKVDEMSNTPLPIASMPIVDMCRRLEDDDDEGKNAYYDCIKGGLSRFCPIDEGDYKLDQYEMNLDDFKEMLSEGVHIVRFNQTLNGGMIACNDITIDVKRD